MKGVPNVIVGYGRTGQSVASYLSAQQIAFAIADDNPQLDDSLHACRIKDLSSIKAQRGIVSPGVPLSHPGLVSAAQKGMEFTNDIEMFCQAVDQPFALITGSNGKSTVTHMVGQLLNAVGVRTGIGGNLGTPCLDLLGHDYERYVLEVSSYQLELARQCEANVACLLNLSPDHLDRYDSVEAYYRVKTHVFNGCSSAIVSREIDARYQPNDVAISFGSDEPNQETEFGLITDANERCLMKGTRRLARCSELSVSGAHNWQNLLAATAIAEALGADLSDLSQVLPAVKGLAHRCETVTVSGPLTVVNDSKATNPASTIAALTGYGDESITLILGGLDKGADFTELARVASQVANRVYVYGQDRQTVAAQLQREISEKQIVIFEQLDDCLRDIHQTVKQGLVLFSPACASFDQFKNFEARGEYFKQKATEVLG